MDRKELVLSIDDVVKLKIKKNLEIDEGFYKKIVYASLFFLTNDYALRQIAISPKSFLGLKRKLVLNLKKNEKKYGVEGKPGKEEGEKIIEEILKKFEKKKLVDDVKYIRFYIRKSKNKSFRQIVYELRREGIDEDVIRGIASTSNVALEKEKIKKVLMRKIKNRSDLLDFKKKNRIILALYRKGFAIDQVKMVIDENLKK